MIKFQFQYLSIKYTVYNILTCIHTIHSANPQWKSLAFVSEMRNRRQQKTLGSIYISWPAPNLSAQVKEIQHLLSISSAPSCNPWPCKHQRPLSYHRGETRNSRQLQTLTGSCFTPITTLVWSESSGRNLLFSPIQHLFSVGTSHFEQICIELNRYFSPFMNHWICKKLFALTP